MDLKQIKSLLEKYYNGESTLNEEKILKEYFKQDDISNDLIADRDIFLYNQEEINNSQDIPNVSDDMWKVIEKSERPNIPIKRKTIYWMYRFAAGIMILLVSFFVLKNQLHENQNVEYQFADTYENPEEAYEQAKQTLLYVSAMLNNGTEHLEPIEKINESTQKLSPISTFNDGIKELNQIKKYQIANKYIKE